LDIGTGSAKTGRAQRPAPAATAAHPRPPRLGTHLAALVLVVLLPAMAFGAAAALDALRRQDAAAEARLRDTARAVAVAVDAQIAGRIAALEVLARSPDSDPIARNVHFRAHAEATAAVFGGWVNLYTPDGAQVMSTQVPPGAPLPGPGGPSGVAEGVIARVAAEGRPVATGLATDRLSGRPAAFVFVPMVREGQARFVLGMPLLPERFAELLAGQAASGRGAAALTDGEGIFIARSRGTEQVLGHRRPKRTDDPIGESGVLRARSLPEDVPIRTAYHRLSSAEGWHAWVNEPESSFAEARRLPLVALVGGGLLALSLGMAIAAALARRMLRPLDELACWAEAVAEGPGRAPATPPPRRAPVREFERLRLAIAGAEAALRRVQRIGRVGGFSVDLRPDARLRSLRSPEYMGLHGGAPFSTVETHQDWVRRLHPEDRERAERCFFDAVADGGGSDYEQEYRVVNADGAVRWIYARAEIERDAAGRAMRMVGAHVDVTALKAAEAALRDREERLRLALEAARLGAWEVDLRDGTAHRTPRALEIFGYGSEAQSAAYPSWRDRVHPTDRAALSEAVDSLRAGRAASYRLEYRFQRPDGRWIWVESHGRAVGQDRLTGLPTRLIGTTQDVTDRKEAEERQEVLVHELDHRAKNTLAVVQAALRLTPRTSAAAFARAVEGRVNALARAHTLLARGGWTGASLAEVAAEALAPFVGSGQPPRTPTIAGPALALSPAAVQALSMVLHELATNAAKHGALSLPAGRVAMTWTIDEAGTLHLVWQEHGGPAVTEPPAGRQGFGASLIAATVTRQLGGRLESRWQPDGLRWEAWLPLARLAAGAAPPAPGRPAPADGDAPPRA
jgi:PAS domain S-box-containing protein